MSRRARHPALEPYLEFLTDTYGISARVQRLAIARAQSPPKITAEQILREQLETARAQRKRRDAIVSTVHRCVCEIVGEHYGVEGDDVADGVLDDDHYVELLNQFVTAGTRQAVMFFYGDYSYPAMSSGRHVPALKDTKLARCIISDGTDVRQFGKCVAVYKMSGAKDLDMRYLQDVSCIDVCRIGRR